MAWQKVSPACLSLAQEAPVQLGALLQDGRGTGATDFGGRAEGYTSFSDVAVAIAPCLGVLHASAPRKPLSAADPQLLSANAGSNQRRRVPGTNRRALCVASLACLPYIAVEPTCCKTCAACIAAPASERLAACIAACSCSLSCSLCRPARPRGHWGGIGTGGGRKGKGVEWDEGSGSPRPAFKFIFGSMRFSFQIYPRVDEVSGSPRPFFKFIYGSMRFRSLLDPPSRIEAPNAW